jgi:hypothetical protein
MRSWIVVSVACVALAALPAAGEPRLDSAVAVYSSDSIEEPPDFAEDFDDDATQVEDAVVFESAITCLVPCVVPVPFAGEAEASAQTDFGRNAVGVWSQSSSSTENSSYQDEAVALSQWRDELTFTSAMPDLIGEVLARFRVEAQWSNAAFFSFVGYLYDPASLVDCPTDVQPPCYEVMASAAVLSRFGTLGGSLFPDVSFDAPYDFESTHAIPTLHPDFGGGDGSAAVEVALPLILDAPIRFGGLLFAEAYTEAGAVNDATAEVLELRVPIGVEVASAADELASYSLQVPEPGAPATGVAAWLAMAALHRRRR